MSFVLILRGNGAHTNTTVHTQILLYSGFFEQELSVVRKK